VPERDAGREAEERRERWVDLSMFWREPTLWPVTFCVIGGFSALGAGAVSMALTQRNPFARMALVVAAALTLVALLDTRSRRGKIAGLATFAGVLWVLSLAGGFVLARLGD
jgi:hypothetical protein